MTIVVGGSNSSRRPLFSASAASAAAVATVLLVRIFVGYQPHSGQDNYHGASPPSYGGDYEAQRHWMELTLHKPIGDWYYYDLGYWGLDYPPLTAYVSYVCGFLSHYVAGPQSVALYTSRGYEDVIIHKPFMRSTVLVLDVVLYGTAVWAFAVVGVLAGGDECGVGCTIRGADAKEGEKRKQLLSSLFFFLFCMLQPAIILIDHGHFQYNTTALGLSLWSFYCMSVSDQQQQKRQSPFRGCIIGSIFFCCALSFKQMTLYYSPVVFFYLLGRCFRKEVVGSDDGDGDPAQHSFSSSPIPLPHFWNRLGSLGVTVISMFGLLWWPFVVYGPSPDIISEIGTTPTPLQRLGQVLHRILPFQRGLFEGKVSNLWCALSIKPIRIRERIPYQFQPIAALLLTLILIAPACYKLSRIGCLSRTSTQRRRRSTNEAPALLWGATNCALAFFLASFQVHEKSLLMALAPATLLWNQDRTFALWFSIVTTWTLWPLLVVDRLRTAYVCLGTIFIALQQVGSIVLLSSGDGSRSGGTRRKASGGSKSISSGFFEQNILFRTIPTLSYTVMLGLHTMEAVMPVSPNLPDLFPVLWSVVGCGFCCLAWIVSCWHLYRTCGSHQEQQLNTNRKWKAE